jgi:hypothetical protein
MKKERITMTNLTNRQANLLASFAEANPEKETFSREEMFNYVAELGLMPLILLVLLVLSKRLLYLLQSLLRPSAKFALLLLMKCLFLRKMRPSSSGATSLT